MKKRKILLIILVILFIISLILWSAPLFAEENLEVSPQELELKELKILPHQPFYFLKNFFWKIKEGLTFSWQKRIINKTKENTQLLLELRETIKKSQLDSSLIEEILGKYEKNQEKLKEEINKYLTKREITEQWLEKILKQNLGQLKILEEILNQNLSSKIKDKLENTYKNQEEWLKNLASQIKEKEKFIKSLEKILREENNPWQIFRSLAILEKTKEGWPEELKNDYNERKEEALINLFTFLNEKTPEEIIQTIKNLAGEKIFYWKIFRELEEKSGQREVFQNLRRNLEGVIDQEEKVENCQKEIPQLKERFGSLKEEAQKLKEPSSNVKILLQQIEAHLKQAEITNPFQIANLCGLVQSAKVLLENTERYLSTSINEELQNKIEQTKKVLENLKAQASQLNTQEWKRIFDLLEEGEKQLEIAQLNYQNDQIQRTEQILFRIKKLINQIEKILSLAKNPQKFEGLNKELFSQEKIEAFRKWCQEQKGEFIEINGLLPSCFLKGNKIKMEDQ